MCKDKRQSNPLEGPERFWIIGGGRFGRIAVNRILGKKPDAVITIVDVQSMRFDNDHITTVRQDGVQWLGAQLVKDAPVDMIIPAAPVHVAAEWLKHKLSIKCRITPFDVPMTWLARMPHPMPGGDGQVYVSHADFVCPDNCPEPERICTHSGEVRPMDLFRVIAGLNFENVVPIVLRSYQLLPGVGGIRPADLLDALKTACTCSGRPVMVVTACRCHGVVDFLRLGPRRITGHPS